MNISVNWCWWRWWAFIKQSIWNSGNSLHHSWIVICIFSNFVKSVQNTQWGKESEHLCPISSLFNNWII